MGGNASNATPPDNRWSAVEKRDRLGRPYYQWMPRLGARFGALVVLTGDCKWATLRCDCGLSNHMETRALRRGRERCAACSQRATAEAQKIGVIENDGIRQLWLHRRSGAISRCYDPKHKAYPNYGGRGISVYAPWVADKLEWLRYAITLPGWDNPKLDIDRVDNEGDYAPGNIRLVSRSENANNRRSTRFLCVEGRDVATTEFWRQYCPGWRSYNALAHHIKQGRTGDEIAAYYQATRVRHTELRA